MNSHSSHRLSFNFLQSETFQDVISQTPDNNHYDKLLKIAFSVLKLKCFHTIIYKCNTCLYLEI